MKKLTECHRIFRRLLTYTFCFEIFFTCVECAYALRNRVQSLYDRALSG